jgi:hypothetical protein
MTPKSSRKPSQDPQSHSSKHNPLKADSWPQNAGNPQGFDAGLQVGDRVQHRKDVSLSGVVVRLTDEKAYVRWEGGEEGRSTPYRLNNLQRSTDR